MDGNRSHCRFRLLQLSLELLFVHTVYIYIWVIHDHDHVLESDARGMGRVRYLFFVDLSVFGTTLQGLLDNGPFQIQND